MSRLFRLTTILIAIWLVLPSSLEGQDLKLSWSDRAPTEGSGELTSINLKVDGTLGIQESAQISLPVDVNQVKNVNAGWDVDGDGAQEIVFPALWVDGEGVSRRSLFVYENTGDDAYEQVWTYQFPGESGEFTTVDVSDLDGDGVSELLAINVRVEGDADDGPEIYIFENVGDNDYGTEPTATWDLGNSARERARVAKAADLDADGQQELVVVTYQTVEGSSSIIVASVSDFALPVWTVEYTNDVGGTTNDLAGLGIGDMDGNGTLEVCTSEQVTEQAMVVYSTGADTYAAVTAKTEAGKAVTVHGTEVVDLDGDGQAECLLANLGGNIYLLDGKGDVSTIGDDDLYLIAQTEEQWLETGIGSTGNSTDLFIAASNDSEVWNYQYIEGGDVTDPESWEATRVVGPEHFADLVAGGIRIYGLDVAEDMDGDGYSEVVFSRGSTKGGADAPVVYIYERKPAFGATSLPVSVNQVKNVNAGWDVDGDGAQEIVFPALWVDGEGVSRRSLFVYENTGDDAYEQVWTYQFPGESGEFTTVDVSDLDGDGVSELLAINVRVEGDADDGPEIYIFENVGDNDYGTEPTATWDLGNSARERARVAKAADLDADGQQELVVVTYQTVEGSSSIIVASVSDFALPVWTVEYTNDVGGTTNDLAGLGIGDMDGNGTLEVCTSEQVTEQAMVVYSTGADTYAAVTAKTEAGKAVTVHGTEVVDLDGDGQAECLLANLGGNIYLLDGKGDVSTIGDDDLYLIAQTEEQWLETGIGSTGNSTDLFIAASNDSEVWNYQYIEGGDVTDPESWEATRVVGPEHFADLVAGGIRIYGLDVAEDMDGDGYSEVVFSRGSTKGGADAPVVYIYERKPAFGATSLPVSVNQVKNVNAGWDVDGDGAQEIVFPALWVDGEGVSRRSLFVYENTGDDAYEQVWTYQFPGESGEFTTVDVSDLDGDGVSELLAINVRVEGDADDGPEIYIFENVGDNDYGTEPTATWDLGNSARERARVAKAADLDADGQQELVVVTYQTVEGSSSIIVASVSDFALPVWTVEYTNDVGGTTNDLAGLGIGDMDGNGTLEVCTSEQVTEQAMVVYSTGADTYAAVTAKTEAGKAVTVHGTEVVDLDGDGQAECLLANLGGNIYLLDGKGDVSTIGDDDLYLIAQTEEQWLETGIGSTGNSTDLFIAASNDSEVWNYQYIEGGDVTDPESWEATRVVGPEHFADLVAGGIRIYGLDVAEDMDGDGYSEVVFSRGSTKGGADAPVIYIFERIDPFGPGEGQPVATEDIELPEGFALLQNYPNPFNPETNIVYLLEESASVRLSVFNAIGQRIRTLDEGLKQAARHTVRWDGKDEIGNPVPGGMYLYRLDVGDKVQTRAMTLVK